MTAGALLDKSEVSWACLLGWCLKMEEEVYEQETERQAKDSKRGRHALAIVTNRKKPPSLRKKDTG